MIFIGCVTYNMNSGACSKAATSWLLEALWSFLLTQWAFCWELVPYEFLLVVLHIISFHL